MRKLRKKVFAAAGYYTISFGSGRKEFNPRKPMPTFETYLEETAKGTLEQVKNPDFDEGVIANFMASRFIKQGNLAGFLPHMVPSLKGKPCLRVEGACGSGGLGIASGIRSILSEQADSVYVAGFEIQNTLKAVYGADVLSGAGYHSGERKNGHAFFFPGVFSDRAGAYSKKFDAELARRGMAKWFELAILNARKNSRAQEHHNTEKDLFALGMTSPNPKSFVEHLNFFDCSKVSDGAASIVIASEEGLGKLGISKHDAVEIVSFSSAEADITALPQDLTDLATTSLAGRQAMQMAGIQQQDIGMLELHDCFSITGLIALEALGFADRGCAAQFVLDGHTAGNGKIPTNCSGGLVGYGHPTGASGVRQLVDLYQQFTGKAENQTALKKDFGLMISMGGNDKTVTSVIVRRT